MNKILLFMLLAVPLIANAQGVKPVVVNANNSVTITASFPDADEVIIRGTMLPQGRTVRTPVGAFGKKQKAEMTKRSNGLWTYTSGALSSEIYTYYFEVDDRDTFDVANPLQVRDINTILNYFIIPGGIADDYVDHATTPRGRVSLVWYKSRIEGLPKRRMAVYTPHGYTRSKRYPVLYLLHGTGGDELSWTEQGRAAQILDNMIASHRCEPMIVVMTNEIADRAATPGDDPYNPRPASGNAVESMLGVTERAFIPEVVSCVDSLYSTLADKDHRAIAGLSLGGLHALFISANYPDWFGYVGLFSAQTTNKIDNSNIVSRIGRIAEQARSLRSLIPSLARGKVGSMVSNVDHDDLAIYDSLDVKLARQFALKPKLYYIACGKDDFVKKLNDDFRTRLDAAHYPYYYNESDGGHTWENWRKYLVDFLPRLFK